jgi:hypothetical protein
MIIEAVWQKPESKEASFCRDGSITTKDLAKKD